MANQARMSGDERCHRILVAARDVFARKGLEGTRTAELARKAGVSERLLYKHFPSKKALYEAALKSYLDEVVSRGNRVLSLEPSTSSLVLLTHFIVSGFLRQSAEHQSFLRFGARSMAEDGDFVRFAHSSGMNAIQEKLQKCIQSAIGAGDIPRGTEPVSSGLFVETLAVGVAHALLPKPPAMDFGLERPQLVEQLVRFSLRGINLDDRAIAQYYNPKALELLSR